MRLSTSLAAILACVSPAFAGVRGMDDPIPFPRLAQGLLDVHGFGDAHPDTFDFEELFAKGFLHTRLGLFDAYMTRAAAAEKADAMSYQKMLVTLLDMQSAWLDWLAPGGVDLSEARADLKTLHDWARSVRGGEVARAAKEQLGTADLVELLGANAEVRAAATRFAEFMGTGAALGLERSDAREPILLAPTRTDFIQLISFAGWARPELQPTFWQQDVKDWTVFYVEDYKVVALELSAPGRGKDDWQSGVSLNARVKNGMEQQVGQHAANSLVDNYFGASIPPALAGGFAVNLVIDVFGECNTRVDGDLRERRTEAIEMFVPGGMSEGGQLPKNSADSRWRKNMGAKRFVELLKTAQKKGASKARRAKSKLEHFELEDDDKKERIVISGPYLGAAAAAIPDPPKKFYGDHLEFLRSYRSCFVYWLRTGAAPEREASEKQFANFLTTLAKAESSKGLEPAFEASFGGRKLSSAAVAEGELEGDFLRWLKKR